MSAQHAEEPEALPVITSQVAHERGLMTMKEIAVLYGVTLSSVRRVLAESNAPAPCALLVLTTGRRVEVYSAIVFDTFVRSKTVEHFRLKHVEIPVRITGTRTRTAGSGYVWRDRRRFRLEPERLPSTWKSR